MPLLIQFTVGSKQKTKNGLKKLAQHIKNQITISKESLGIVVSKFEEKHYKKREHLLEFDKKSNYEYFITKGCVRTYILDYNGVEHNLFFSIENWWTGDLQSFMNKTPATYNIQALEDTLVLSINRANWNFLLEEVPEFLKYSHRLFQKSIIALQNRTIQNLSFTAKHRYEHFIEHYPELVQRIPQKHIASYIGITAEFLSMLRNQKNK